MISVRTQELKKWFSTPVLGIALTPHGEKNVKAVDGVSLSIKKGEIHGLVGESGSGKTTTGKLIAKLLEPSSGTIIIDGVDISKLSGNQVKEFRRKVQYVFQDPYASLDENLNVRKIMADPLRVLGISATDEELIGALERCELSPGREFLRKYPKHLSGGQRQRLCLARILLLQPKVVIADEVVSMLDVSTRVGILDLIAELRKEEGITYIFITHDVVSADYLCDNISVMYLGKIVESGQSREIILNPRHPYTRILMAAVPRLDEKVSLPSDIGELPDAMNIPPGCSFNPRCPFATEICVQQVPRPNEIAEQHFVSCHHATEINSNDQPQGRWNRNFT